MANFMLHNNVNFRRKTGLRQVAPTRATASPEQVSSNATMHDAIAERAQTSCAVEVVTKVDASMSREEIIAKIMGSRRTTVQG